MDQKKYPEFKLKSELRMPAEKVTELYRLFEDNAIEIWLDGGWGVDALLEEQTREHADLDIVVQRKDVAKMRSLLEERGYTDIDRDDTGERNFVLGDGTYEIDVHAITIDENGVGLYNSEKNEHFSAGSLNGVGTINGLKVRCIAPEWTVQFHTGYELSNADRHDVRAICDKFGVPLPESHKP